ncbi:TauD/TfdA dioxygenase family protein [Falsiroseomonas stagni]|nr:TauD/TfdA family dioxygenase [Falsiroseomonas stagni]
MSSLPAAILDARPAALSARGLETRPLHPAFGVEILGLDVTRDLDEAGAAALRQALEAHEVVVLRGQALDPVQQVAFTARLGTLSRHPLSRLALPGLPEVVLEQDEPDDRHAQWHAHMTWAAEPSRYSALFAAAIPAEGGVIAFASQVAAYARLDPHLRERIEYLAVEHAHPRGRAAGLAPVVHPLVRIDPATGRRALVLDHDTTARVRGLPEGEGAALLHRLLGAATDPAITLRHRWREGDLVVWDNRAVLHRAAFPAAWRLHRTMVRGSRPLGPADLVTPWVSAG